MQQVLLKIRYFERGLSKSLKKVNFILPNLVPSNTQSYQKQKRPGTIKQLLFKLGYERSSEKFLY